MVLGFARTTSITTHTIPKMTSVLATCFLFLDPRVSTARDAFNAKAGPAALCGRSATRPKRNLRENTRTRLEKYASAFAFDTTPGIRNSKKKAPPASRLPPHVRAEGAKAWSKSRKAKVM